ncbi:hypothetical protein JDV02_004240 [Purpureocillium takamizusanense]|uniref:Methyltransferase domain-containing protein n=1 Tax=Purpureocillium takamizusanense TaxID=2060973 RepID=A0A9Q8QDD9_9HYPO|nr:uncharacterized protein JDV02_004240 [Purpureocillium takamizusanense]UNI17933.1 hypothetical protein JDV02_004240 [Purpureocillium takamizusanense]
MAGELAFNAAFMTSGTMLPVPIFRTRQPQQQQQRQRRRSSGLPPTARRSNSTSRADYQGTRRRVGHSRTSSGSQASRSSHETLLHDRPATNATTTASTAGSFEGLRPAAGSPRVASAKSPSSMNRSRFSEGVHGFDMNVNATSAESVSSASGTTSVSAHTTMTSDPAASDGAAPRPLVLRNGRTYIHNIPYPLPSDLTELHRQSLRTLLLIQLFGAPVCSPALIKKPPQRVLEVGCGSGFWSMMCHRYFKGRGHGNISFTGIDIAPLAPEAGKPDPDMKWRFVGWDLRQLPWPLHDGEFDLVMVKDMSLATTNKVNQAFIDEYLRLLRPGGTLEIWESDHLIRMLRPHVPGSAQGGGADADEQEAAASLGAYVMSANTPLSAPLNAFLVEYNNWLSRALENLDLNAVPCTLIGPVLLQESETLADVRSRRLAVPLSEVRWEREGVDVVVTRNGQEEGKGKGVSAQQRTEQRALTAGQHALRKTALLTVVQQVQALEPILREVSGKSQDEWDVWLGKMMGDLLSDGGASWGECLEVGAWWAKKRGDD